MSYKQKVASNVGAAYTKRFSNQFWVYRRGQLTTSNIKAMKSSGIPMGTSASSDSPDTPVISNLQSHALHTFSGDDRPSLLVAVPKDSPHVQNVKECAKGSLMVGHTDPQVFHWFKQLGILPPRSIASGALTLLDGAERAEAWEKTFAKHPSVHALAEKMWASDDSKTATERDAVDRLAAADDAARLARASSSDWRAKHHERVRSPKGDEDEEMPLYVLKDDTFAIIKLVPDVRLWATMNSQMNRVYEPRFQPRGALARATPRFLRLLNGTREQLIPSLNINYNLKLINGFVFELDEEGFYLMGTEENFDKGTHVEGREAWHEYRINYGMDKQVMKTEAEMEWWIKGLSHFGTPEAASATHGNSDAAAEKPFRHT